MLHVVVAGSKAQKRDEKDRPPGRAFTNKQKNQKSTIILSGDNSYVEAEIDVQIENIRYQRADVNCCCFAQYGR